MNTQIATVPAEGVNLNSRRPQRGPTCACGKRDYCDNSCNTFAATDAPDFYTKRREYHAKSLWAMDAAGAAAEGETFSEWTRRTSRGGR
jgi:hypothetical protein